MRDSKACGNVITYLFMSVLGLILLIPSAYKLYHYSVFRLNSVSTVGRVEKSSGGSTGFGGRPLVAYKDAQGNAYVMKSLVKTHFLTSPVKGEKVRILYLKQDSKTAIVDSRFHNIVLPLIFLGIGASVVFAALKKGRSDIRVSRHSKT